jgi:hypothetical protein
MNESVLLRLSNGHQHLHNATRHYQFRHPHGDLAAITSVMSASCQTQTFSLVNNIIGQFILHTASGTGGEVIQFNGRD